MNPFSLHFQNPFWVLGLDPGASRVEIERQAKKVEAMLSVGKAGADAWAGPLATGKRTPEIVRWAATELADPGKRLVWELWATPVPGPPPERDVLPLPLASAMSWKRS